MGVYLVCSGGEVGHSLKSEDTAQQGTGKILGNIGSSWRLIGEIGRRKLTPGSHSPPSVSYLGNGQDLGPRLRDGWITAVADLVSKG